MAQVGSDKCYLLVLHSSQEMVLFAVQLNTLTFFMSAGHFRVKPNGINTENIKSERRK